MASSETTLCVAQQLTKLTKIRNQKSNCDEYRWQRSFAFKTLDPSVRFCKVQIN